MNNMFITTTGLTSSVILYDLGERTINHPVSDYEITTEFTYRELIESYDFTNSIDNGYLTASVSNITITQSNNLDNTINARFNNLDISYAKTLYVGLTYSDIVHFISINDAINTITDSDEFNRYLIFVGPGVYNEPLLDLSNKPYVSIAGDALQTVVVRPNDVNHHVFRIGSYNELSFLTIENAGSGYAGLAIDDTGDFSQAHKVAFVDCDINILITSTTQDTYFYGEYIDFSGTYSFGVKAESSNGFGVFANLENYYNIPNFGVNCIGTYLKGENTSVDVLASGQLGGGTGSAFYLEDGAFMKVNSTDINDWGYGIVIGNVGTSSGCSVISTNIADSVYKDILINHPYSYGNFSGVARSLYVDIEPSNTLFTLAYSEPGGGYVITGDFKLGNSDSELTNVSDLILEGSPLGIYGGGLITIDSGLNINVTGGYGYLEDPIIDVTKRVEWSDTFSIPITPNSIRYVYVDLNGVNTQTSLPNLVDKILLGRVISDNSSIVSLNNTPASGHHYTSGIERYRRDILQTVFDSGCVVGTSSNFELDVSSGVYYFSNNRITPIGGTSISFTPVYKNSTSGLWNYISSTTSVPNTQYDGGTGSLVNITNSKLVKHSLYVNGSIGGLDEKYFLLYGQEEFDTLSEAESNPSPTPPDGFTEGITLISDIIITGGSSSITDLVDRRRFFNVGGVSSGGSVIDHGNLLGLGDDDHTQYFLVDGTRSFTGNINLGGYQITNVGNVDGVDISAHASRHLPNGSDPISTSSAVSIGNTNSVGIANSLSRADHVHKVGNILHIDNALETFQYQITGGAIVANRILNLPLLTGTDTLVTQAFAQSLTNKTGYNGLIVTPNTGVITGGTWSGSTIIATVGGTGQTSYVVGDVLFANTTTSLSKLADVSTGNALISGGVGVAPSYGKIGLTTHITGTLPITNGGTGQTTKAAGFNALSPNTTKGDITVFTTTNVRLPIGATAGQVLIVDSTQAAGMRWASSSEIAGQTLRFLSANSANSQTVSNTTTETNFTTNGTNYPIPANTIKQYSVLRFLVYGRFSTKNGSVGTLSIRLKIGTLVINTNVCDLGSSTTNLGFQFTGQVQCRTSGAGGTIYSHLLCVFNGNSSTPPTFASSSNGTNTFDTTISNTIQMSAQWSNANANNSITVEQATFEVLN